MQKKAKTMGRPAGKAQFTERVSAIMLKPDTKKKLMTVAELLSCPLNQAARTVIEANIDAWLQNIESRREK